MNETVILPALWVPVVSAVLLPLLNGYLVKDGASPRVHFAVAAVLSGLVAVAEALIDGEPDTYETLLVAGIVAFGAQVVGYAHGWKAFGINSRLAPASGLGTVVDVTSTALDEVALHGEPQDSASAAAIEAARKDATK